MPKPEVSSRDRSARTPSVAPGAAEADISRFYGTKGSISITKLAAVLGLSKRQLAETLAAATDKVARSRASEMAEIVHRIRDWSGGDAQALAWYRAEPIPAFGGRTAESLVQEGKAAAVRDYLDHVATGGFA